MCKTERFSLTFTVNNFSQVTKELLSPPVIVHNLKWRICIEPTYKKVDGQQEKRLGYYLQCDGIDGEGDASSWSCQLTASLRVIAVKQGVDNVSKEFSRLFSSKSQPRGWTCYMKWEDVMSTKRGLIEGDSVTFLVHVAADEPIRCEKCEERVCKICLKNEVRIVFDPCGHLATCTKCSLDLNECPICRRKINKKIRVYV